MKKSTKKILCCVCVLAAIALAVFGLTSLPDSVAAQLGLSGQVTRTMPKVTAVLIPALLSVTGGIIGFTEKDEKSHNGLILSAFGLVFLLAVLLINS